MLASGLGNLFRKSFRFAKRQFDHRCRFRDLSVIDLKKRAPRSPVLQFYSSMDNIGNYLPVLGIQTMLSFKPDAWCVHDRNIDFTFINNRYKGVIVGGAGLLDYVFEPFWNKLINECKLPIVIWGVGGCFQDGYKKVGVSKRIISEALRISDLVNVRDDLTANYYCIKNAHISACPTIAYLDTIKKNTTADSLNLVVFSSHEQLVSTKETMRIIEIIKSLYPLYRYTDNIQRFSFGLDDIIKKYYCRSVLVVTTRLHGAIIAYGLGIPYVAVPRDEKIRSFNIRYCNGVCIENVEQLEAVLSGCVIRNKDPIKISEVYEYGKRVNEWLKSI